MTLASNRLAVERAVADADLVIGAVLVPGGRAPVVVTEAMVRSMRPGAVIVDCAIDQGGSVEDIHETSHDEPVYVRHGVLHYAVGNIPGAVPHTSTYTLTNATLPYAVALATLGRRRRGARRPRDRRRRQHLGGPDHERCGRRPRSGREAVARSPKNSRSAYGRAPGDAGQAVLHGRVVGHRHRLAEQPERTEVVVQHELCRVERGAEHLGIEVGALVGRLGEVPGVCGHVEDRDVHRYPGRHLAERQRDDLLGDAGRVERLAWRDPTPPRTRPCSRSPRLSPTISSPSFSSDTFPSRRGDSEHVGAAGDVVQDVAHRPAVARSRVVELIGLDPVDDPRRLAEHLVDHDDRVHDAPSSEPGLRSRATRLIRRRRPGGSLRRRRATRERSRHGRPAWPASSSPALTGVGTPWSRPSSTISPLR